jgi:hypothetical protein
MFLRDVKKITRIDLRTGKDAMEISCPQRLVGNFANNAPVIGSDNEVAAFIQLLVCQAGHLL